MSKVLQSYKRGAYAQTSILKRLSANVINQDLRVAAIWEDIPVDPEPEYHHDTVIGVVVPAAGIAVGVFFLLKKKK